MARDDEKNWCMINLLFSVSTTALGSKVAILEDMAILFKHRGKGICAKLIDYAISEATKDGCKRITLLTDTENTKAQSFYQKRGFVKSKMTAFRLFLETETL